MVHGESNDLQQDETVEEMEAEKKERAEEEDVDTRTRGLTVDSVSGHDNVKSLADLPLKCLQHSGGVNFRWLEFFKVKSLFAHSKSLANPTF